MTQNNNTFRGVSDEFAAKRRRAEEDADTRRLQAEQMIDGLREIHIRLAESGYEIFSAALTGGDIDAKMACIKAENESLRQKKRELLLAAGLPEDYTEPRYECPICHDTGYSGGLMCRCFKEALTLARLEKSGLGQLVRTQSFDSFSFDYYTGADQAMMRMNVKALKEFAENFTGKGDRSWLFFGDTGLGKTHLSSSVAMELIHRGFDVVYMTAGSFFSVFEKQRFGDGRIGDGTDDQFYETDLLIIDDLGTEPVNQFTLSCLYNIINSRMINGKSTIINTNLNREELRRKYADRIVSRLFGEFIPVPFAGKDIRQQKISK
ncbi:MAG: ATP-binding protein [Clostridia bacterium]|nr:ATP-binding protein [Clostridia bacterium]